MIGFVHMDFLRLARWIEGGTAAVPLWAGDVSIVVTLSSGPLYSESELISLLDPRQSLPFIPLR